MELPKLEDFLEGLQKELRSSKEVNRNGKKSYEKIV